MQSILINGGSVTLAFPKADEMPITLRAVYRVPPTREAHPRTPQPPAPGPC
jgi:hypothetical protein